MWHISYQFTPQTLVRQIANAELLPCDPLQKHAQKLVDAVLISLDPINES
jgi:hypothetical protein